MVEPISIISAIATSISLLSLAIHAAGEIRYKYVEFREAEGLFKYRYLRLMTCQSSMKYWTLFWTIPNGTQYSRVIAWGSDGVVVMDLYLEEIKRLTKKIREMLQLDRSTVERRAWYHATNANDKIGAVNALSASVKKTFLFVLYKNSELNEKINRLQHLIAGLAEESCLRWSLQHTGERVNPTKEEIFQVSKLNQIRDFMSGWYKICVAEDTDDWALELRLPSTSEFDIWEFVEEATINFTLIDGTLGIAPQLSNFGRIQISLRKDEELNNQSLPLSETALYELFRNAKARKAQGTFISYADSLFELNWIEPPTRNMIERYRWSQLLKANCSSETESLPLILERTSLAYGTAIWILILLSTPWLSRLCSCGFHTLSISGGNMCNIHLPKEECSCGRLQGSEDRILLYGILLCELAIGKPVSIISMDGSKHFIIDDQALTKWQLLQKLGEGKESSRYEKAVRFCLNFASGSQEKTPDVQTINAYIKGVLEPIRVLHNANRRREQRRRQREGQPTLVPS